MRNQLGIFSKSVGRYNKGLPLTAKPLHGFRQQRWISISAHLTSSSQQLDQLPINPAASNVGGPDAQFEVLGAPFSLLSVSLAASQTLYTRRGTLIGLSGKAENTLSSLSTLEPLRRAVLGIPFFYQKITSASPINALISTKSALTSFTVVHLDGTLDWMITQKRALIAWTGQTLSITPRINYQLAVAHWGFSQVTGRGLLGLVGKGQIYQISLQEGESYVAHPSNIVAYTMSQNPPQPYRFRSSTLRLEVPGLTGIGRLLPNIKFFRSMQETPTWKFLHNIAYKLRTWSRRTIFGDRLFLRFQGPATLLVQTRASRMSDVFTTREINEVADTPAGAVTSAVASDLKKAQHQPSSTHSTTRLEYSNIGGSSQVTSQPSSGESKKG